MASSVAGSSTQKPILNPYQPFTTLSKNERLQFSSLHPFTPTFIETHIGKSKNLDPNALYENRVKERTILLENPTRDSRTKKKEEERKKQRQKDAERKKQKLISKKEAKLKGLWSLEKTQKRYELFVPLHHLWLGYMSELLGLGQIPTPIPDKPPLPNSGALHAKLVKADFHGSIMTVKKAKNPCLVGISGIVLLETENAFRIINIKNQVKLIPKQASIFSFRIPLYDVRSLLPSSQPSNTQEDTEMAEGDSPASTPLDLMVIPHMEFELYGNQFRFRAAERAGKKFKAKETIEL